MYSNIQVSAGNDKEENKDSELKHEFLPFFNNSRKILDSWKKSAMCDARINLLLHWKMSSLKPDLRFIHLCLICETSSNHQTEMSVRFLVAWRDARVKERNKTGSFGCLRVMWCDVCAAFPNPWPNVFLFVRWDVQRVFVIRQNPRLIF